MTIADLYLICFAVGFLLSLVSFALGNLHIHLHLPFHIHVGPAHVGHAPAGTHAMANGSLPAINIGTITVFLAWFGGVGYLLTQFSGLYGVVALLLAILAGMVGASIVFLLITRLLLAHERELDPTDYEMVGVLGKVTSSIREGGTGEIVYSQEGTRHTTGARSEDGKAIAKGVEVVVTRYEKGIAYVRLWEEMAAGSDLPLVTQ